MKLGHICLSSLACVTLVFAAGSANAKEELIDHTYCAAAEQQSLAGRADLGVFQTDFQGILQNSERKGPLHGASGWCKMLHHGNAITGAIENSQGYCVVTDSDGDSILMTAKRDSGKSVTYTAVGGTGKWQGITGAAKAVPYAITRPTAAGTYEFCSRITGNYKLPH